MTFSATRDAGLTRLATFLPRAGRAYAAQRNYDDGPGRHEHVSVLSPWLRFRLVTEAEVLDAVLTEHAPSACDKFTDEVLWRTYWKGWLEHRPTAWIDYRDAVRSGFDQLAADGALRQDYERAVEGRTGIDAFDSWARELVDTGYVHNHARMWFASIWIFTLGLPWALGADFYLRHLIDGDAASNTLSWRWVAGLHNAGKSYRARADNIQRYTRGRFRPQSLAADAPALTQPANPEPQAPALPSKAPGGGVGLLITSDDLHAESFDGIDQQQIEAVALLDVDGQRSPEATGAAALAFERAARADALARASMHFGLQVTPLASTAAIGNWLDEAGLGQAVTPWVTVGPLRESLEVCGAAERIVALPRSFDRLAWPQARAGFFRLKKFKSRLLRELDLGQRRAA